MAITSSDVISDYITHTHTGEPAQQVEVRVGDAVMMVNDTDVRRANAELIKNLIE